jgi:putative ABC transport system ATP-binding protein
VQANAELGATTLVITHNAAIQDIAHRVVHFGNGRIVSVRTNAERKAAAEITW